MNKYSIDLKSGMSYSKPYISKFSSNFDKIEFLVDCDDKLSECTFAVIYTMCGETGMDIQNGGKLTKIINDENNKILLEWILDTAISCESGVVIYQVVGYVFGDDGNCKAIWYSPQGRIVVGDSIDTTEYETLNIGAQPSLVAQLLSSIENAQKNILNVDQKCEKNKNDILNVDQKCEQNKNDILNVDQKCEQNKNDILNVDQKCEKNKNDILNVDQKCEQNKNDILNIDEKIKQNKNDILQINLSSNENAQNIAELDSECQKNKSDISQLGAQMGTVSSHISDIFMNMHGMSENISLNDTAIKTNADRLSQISNRLDVSELNIETKVTKQTGKGLSTEDFTSEEKQQLSYLANYFKPIPDGLTIDDLYGEEYIGCYIEPVKSYWENEPITNKYFNILYVNNGWEYTPFGDVAYDFQTRFVWDGFCFRTQTRKHYADSWSNWEEAVKTKKEVVLADFTLEEDVYDFTVPLTDDAYNYRSLYIFIKTPSTVSGQYYIRLRNLDTNKNLGIISHTNDSLKTSGKVCTKVDFFKSYCYSFYVQPVNYQWNSPTSRMFAYEIDRKNAANGISFGTMTFPAGTNVRVEAIL